MVNKQSNYNVPFNYAREKLKHINPKTISKLSGIDFDKSKSIFTVDFLGDIYYVNYPDGEIYNNDGSICTNLSLKIIIIRYLINSTGEPPVDRYISYKEVPGGHVFYPNYKKTIIDRLALEFECCIDKYKQLMDSIHAERISMGDLAYKFRYIGNTYMIFILWFKDDEFEQTSNVLMDANAIQYFNAEDLAVCPGLAIDIIRKKIQE